ncbi:6202_t:CDS:2 [Paraglomus occultum]|uniref:6202_t:CDS:1 n=1 Tax=Paraglomus occultum TaxID=144539 RepID=A0A9N9G0Z1_9GLOM|nr:6202_t:CDS:2 [Paraglomus occultum]
MSNPNRASRHASGILPSKQFFAPRKPIPSYPASARRKSTLSATSPGSPTSNAFLSPSSSIRTPITSLISEEGTSTYLQRNSIPLDPLSSPTHETIDTTDENTIYVVRQSAYHARRSRQASLSAAGVLDPTSPSSVLEPTSSVRARSSDPMGGVNNKRLSSKHSSFLAVPYSSVKAKPNVQLTSHTGGTPSSEGGRRRVYQLWPGRNRFFLGGRIMTSRDFPAFAVALSALIIPSSLFLAFTCPFLYSHLSPAVVFVFAYLFLLALTSMLKTSWSDPGIIPRNLDPTPPIEESEVLDNIGQNDTPFPYYQSRTYVLPKDVKLRAPIARRNGARHPFDRHNLFKNCFWVLCRPSITSTIHRRAFVDATLPSTTAPTPTPSFPNLFSTAAVSPLNTRQSQTQIHETVGSRDHQATMDANIA